MTFCVADSTGNGPCPKVLKPISVCRLWLNEGDDATVEPLSDLGHERDNVVEQSVRRPVFFLAAIRGGNDFFFTPRYSCCLILTASHA